MCLPPPLQLFSVIVFGCVADKVIFRVTGFPSTCLYNQSSACSFAIAVGVIGFLIFIVFLVKDILYIILDFSDGILVSVRRQSRFPTVYTHTHTHTHTHTSSAAEEGVADGGRSDQRPVGLHVVCVFLLHG